MWLVLVELLLLIMRLIGWLVEKFRVWCMWMWLWRVVCMLVGKRWLGKVFCSSGVRFECVVVGVLSGLGLKVRLGWWLRKRFWVWVLVSLVMCMSWLC